MESVVLESVKGGGLVGIAFTRARMEEGRGVIGTKLDVIGEAAIVE